MHTKCGGANASAVDESELHRGLICVATLFYQFVILFFESWPIIWCVRVYTLYVCLVL